jgi:hypothetical protein
MTSASRSLRSLPGGHGRQLCSLLFYIGHAADHVEGGLGFSKISEEIPKKMMEPWRN